MLSIFTIPKPFQGHNEIIQRNAIQSWIKIKPLCEIILCGNEHGVANLASEYNILHLPDISRNEYGTPLLNSAFNKVQQRAQNHLLCYVNADIIILSDITSVIRNLQLKRFLLLGQRWNLDLEDFIDFEQSTWEHDLRYRLSHMGNLQPPNGSDYFVFPRDMQWDFPDFAVGRPGWDNWFIYRARALQIPVVDATEVLTVIHQNHNYSHIPKGKNPSSFEGPEADHNRKLMGGADHDFYPGDATHRLNGKSLEKALDYKYLKYRLKHQRVLDPSKSVMTKIRWRLLESLLYRRKYFPKWLWQNIIYSLSK